MSHPVQGLTALTAPGISVVLPRSCSAQERRERGDGRELFVRYREDHTMLINERLFSTETALRNEIVHEMSSRQERAIFFVADATLNYGEVAFVLSDLEKDAARIESDPPLFVLLITKRQIEATLVVRWTYRGEQMEFKNLCFAFASR